jgi:hypothetical protein
MPVVIRQAVMFRMRAIIHYNRRAMLARTMSRAAQQCVGGEDQARRQAKNRLHRQRTEIGLFKSMLLFSAVS